MKDAKVLRWALVSTVELLQTPKHMSGSLAGVTGPELGFKVFLSFWISAMSLSSLAWAMPGNSGLKELEDVDRSKEFHTPKHPKTQPTSFAPLFSPS